MSLHSSTCMRPSRSARSACCRWGDSSCGVRPLDAAGGMAAGSSGLRPPEDGACRGAAAASQAAAGEASSSEDCDQTLESSASVRTKTLRLTGRFSGPPVACATGCTRAMQSSASCQATPEIRDMKLFKPPLWSSTGDDASAPVVLPPPSTTCSTAVPLSLSVRRNRLRRTAV